MVRTTAKTKKIFMRMAVIFGCFILIDVMWSFSGGASLKKGNWPGIFTQCTENIFLSIIMNRLKMSLSSGQFDGWIKKLSCHDI